MIFWRIVLVFGTALIITVITDCVSREGHAVISVLFPVSFDPTDV